MNRRSGVHENNDSAEIQRSGAEGKLLWSNNDVCFMLIFVALLLGQHNAKRSIQTGDSYENEEFLSTSNTNTDMVFWKKGVSK